MKGSALAQRRLGAWLIDVVIVAGIGTLFHFFGWVATAAYWLCRDGCFDGQSIGKRLVGLKVVVEPSGTRCTWKTSCIRNLLWVIPVIDLLMGATGLYYLFSDPAGRHWGDRLADTRVVKVSAV